MDKPTIKKMSEDKEITEYKIGDSVNWISEHRTKKTVTLETNSGTVMDFRTVKQMLCKNEKGKTVWVDMEVIKD